MELPALPEHINSVSGVGEVRIQSGAQDEMFQVWRRSSVVKAQLEHTRAIWESCNFLPANIFLCPRSDWASFLLCLSTGGLSEREIICLGCSQDSHTTVSYWNRWLFKESLKYYASFKNYTSLALSGYTFQTHFLYWKCYKVKNKI